MKKYNFLMGLTLLIVSIILSNIFNENTITNRAINLFLYLPIAYSFVKAFCSQRELVRLLLVSALICSIFISLQMGCIGLPSDETYMLSILIHNTFACYKNNKVLRPVRLKSFNERFPKGWQSVDNQTKYH